MDNTVLSGIYLFRSIGLKLGLNFIATLTNQLIDHKNYGFEFNLLMFLHFIFYSSPPHPWGLN